MDLFTTFLIAVFFFIMGAAIVGLIWYLRGVSTRIGKGAKTSTPEDPNLSEIAHLMRHLQTQELVVEMDGNSFASYHELSPAQQRRLTFTSNVLTKWLAEPPPEPHPAEEAGTMDAEAPPTLSMPFDPQPAAVKESYIPPFTVEPMQEVKPVSTGLADMVGGMLNPVPQPTPAYKSVASQINDILQEHLSGTGLESRGITLQDALDRGVTVTLDGKQYNSVMDVPDEEVRNIIRDAVVEWETKK